MTTTSPLLAVGTFGVHLLCCNNVYSFAGTVPNTIKVGGYTSYHDGVVAFATWFKDQDIKFQREHVAYLRDDVFFLVLSN
jgi:hypothetical protein